MKISSEISFWFWTDSSRSWKHPEAFLDNFRRHLTILFFWHFTGKLSFPYSLRGNIHFPPTWASPPADATLCLASGRKGGENWDISALQPWRKKQKAKKEQTNNTLSWWQNTAMPVQCTMFVTPWKRKREARHSIVYNGRRERARRRHLRGKRSFWDCVMLLLKPLRVIYRSATSRPRWRTLITSADPPPWKRPLSASFIYLFFSVCVKHHNWKIPSGKVSLDLKGAG